MPYFCLETPLMHRELECQTILYVIGQFNIEKALSNLDTSVNLLLYTLYNQLCLGKLKSTLVTLRLLHIFVCHSKGVIKDVLVQINNFYISVDFIVFDIAQVTNACLWIPIILERPIFATANTVVNCRNGVIKLSFSNMTLEFNIFNICKQPSFDTKKYKTLT